MGDLRQRDAQVRVQLDDQGDDLGAELHAGRPQRIGGLQRVPTRNTAPTLRAVTDLDVEAAHDGTHHRESIYGLLVEQTCSTVAGKGAILAGA